MARLYGTDGTDSLLGTVDDDDIYGWRQDGAAADFGADFLRGFAGNDRLWGGAGNDLFVGDGGADIFTGGAGIDVVSYHTTSAGVEVDLASGGRGGDALGDLFGSIENVLGSVGADRIYGDNAANFLEGLDGHDVFNGREGDDFIRGGMGADIISGGVGNDTATYHGSNAAVVVNLFTMTASGGEAEGDSFGSIENIIGSAFDDRLTGDQAANLLQGGAGNDRLFGGLGADVLVGGAGSDRFEYTSNGLGDTILDFSGLTNFNGGAGAGDKIHVTVFGQNSLEYIGDAAFSSRPFVIEARVNGDHVLIDTDWDGVANIDIVLTGLSDASQLIRGDFILLA